MLVLLFQSMLADDFFVASAYIVVHRCFFFYIMTYLHKDLLYAKKYIN